MSSLSPGFLRTSQTHRAATAFVRAPATKPPACTPLRAGHPQYPAACHNPSQTPHSPDGSHPRATPPERLVADLQPRPSPPVPPAASVRLRPSLRIPAAPATFRRRQTPHPHPPEGAPPQPAPPALELRPSATPKPPAPVARRLPPPIQVKLVI